VEALGRALREALERHGEARIVTILGAMPAAAAPVLLAGLREALQPARLDLLTDEQRAADSEASRRRQRERPDDYLRLRLDPAEREAFMRRVRAALEHAS
jgi:hypothetical protein